MCTLRGPEDDSERVETCRPKITFYVIKLLCLTDMLYYICIDKHIGMTNIKKNVLFHSQFVHAAFMKIKKN